MQFYLVLISLATLALTVSSKPGLHHYASWGTRGPYDVLLFRETIVAKGKWFRVTKVDLTYPKRGQPGGTITAITVYNRSTDGKGGYAKLKSGGVGQSYVDIRVKSHRGNGMNFTVEIYGHK